MKKIFLILSVFAVHLCFSQKVKSVTVKEAKTTEQKLELSKDKIELFNGKFVQFITALKTSDKKTMESLLSDNAKTAVTDKVYKRLTEDIHFDKKLEIFKTGYKSLIGGGNYPMIQYKYSDDKSTEPKEIITAVFEENGKILGIKPYKQTK
ncbi:hypothetical protein SAMN05421664_3779 [Chryseobacterium soldanellicola]|uniref:Uncharacterized protein n=1 Tax=Chryseobacterium soldanellicola TaxID=311333 RepID=A0A1H1GNT3_9FLAO|nr:hypothetical protein [Chryseobacterium soldanellicola]SDR14568.1 hypothetical protein SAMN05421664_3779 [Chryseobacterium soldanellicola]